MTSRVYATVADYRAWSGQTFPPDARVTVLLARASADVDRAMIGAVYATNPATGMPTDAAVADTFNRATCAQVQFRADLDDDTGTKSRLDAVSIGGISIHRAAGTTGQALPPIGPEALQILQLDGALPTSPLMGW